jgi:hypothetical protein
MVEKRLNPDMYADNPQRVGEYPNVWVSLLLPIAKYSTIQFVSSTIPINRSAKPEITIPPSDATLFCMRSQSKRIIIIGNPMLGLSATSDKSILPNNHFSFPHSRITKVSISNSIPLTWPLNRVMRVGRKRTTPANMGIM